jgi:hypothetical protein
MDVLIGWIVLCLLVAWLARSRGRSALGYFILSLFLSPLIGLIVVLVAGSGPAAANELARLEAARAGGLLSDEEYGAQAAIIARGGQLTATALTGKVNVESVCGRCGKRLSPAWRGRCGHCGAAYSEFPPQPA